MQQRSITYIFILLITLLACEKQNPPAVTSPVSKPINPEMVAKPEPIAKPLRDLADTVNYEQRIPQDFKGNYVWAAATNLAWNALKDSILKGNAQMRGLDADGQSMQDRLNASAFSQRDLDAESYYVKAGYGPATVREIYRAMAARFPSVDFQLDQALEPQEIIIFACLYKALKYLNPFAPKPVKFMDKEVKGFVSMHLDEKIRIIHYESDDQFMIKIELKDQHDELILCKGYPMETPEPTLDLLAQYQKRRSTKPGELDDFMAPTLHLKTKQSFGGLTGHFFENKGFEAYRLVSFYESVIFDMDEEGVKIVAMTQVKGGKDAIKGLPPKPKHFYLDQPYWVMMKRRDSPLPYFILGVRNAAMMERVAGKHD